MPRAGAGGSPSSGAWRPARAILVSLMLTAGLVLPMGVARAATPRFQIRCQTSHVAQEDPIVSPGSVSAHLHEFFGNITTGAFSTYESMIAGGTTCSAVADTAGYWVPTLIAPDGEFIRAGTILVYYRGEEGATTAAFPPDLRMIADEWAVGTDRSHLIIKFPDCWDGIQTDSLDHISHMSSSTGQGCPSTHPIRVPAITVVVRYPVQDVSDFTLSSGPLTTLHADFWNTWDQVGLESLVSRCLNDSTTSCPRIDGEIEDLPNVGEQGVPAAAPVHLAAPGTLGPTLPAAPTQTGTPSPADASSPTSTPSPTPLDVTGPP